MKQYLTRFSVLAVLIASFAFISGCKDTIPDPGFVDFGQIRIMNFMKCTPIKIDIIPDGTTDTTHYTPTALTYAMSTPYINNLPTNREAGRKYNLYAYGTDGTTIIATTSIVLKPGDKKSWLIYDNQRIPDQSSKVQDDNPPAGGNPGQAYFRFINTLPDYEPDGLALRIGDAIHGKEITRGSEVFMRFKDVSDYAGIDTALDTTLTFFVVKKDGTVLARLAGVSLEAGTYQTITFAGYGPNDGHDCYRKDNQGDRLIDDTLRLRVLDDNTSGNDLIGVQNTLRFNIVNALLPPISGSALPNPYPQGVSFIINNNTSYDFKNVQLYQGVPTYDASFSADAVQNVAPRSIPLTGVVYVKAVKAGGEAPGSLDQLLFRFYANSQVIKSDQLMSIVVFDSVQKNLATAAAPYDSSKGVMTLPIPDQSVDGNAVVVVAAASSGAYRTTGTVSFSVDRQGQSAFTKVKQSKTYEVETFPVDGNTDVTYEGTVKVGTNAPENIQPITFKPQPGGIYEVLVVGRYHDPNNNTPRFIVIRTNPIK